MVKNTPKICYEFEGRSLTLSQIYRKIRKRKGRAKTKGSVIVEIGEDKKAKLVFVRNRNQGVKWLALLCTNLSLSDDEVVRIYGKRWDIEVFFKKSKLYLKLDSKIQVRDFDSIVAYSTIVMICYIFLALNQRISTDARTIGALFLAAMDELRDIALAEALVRILSLVSDRLHSLYQTSEHIVLHIMESTMNEALKLTKPNFHAKWES